jgi:hypothetical protein
MEVRAHDEAHGGGWLQKMDTFSIGLLKEKEPPAKNYSQNNNVTKERRNKCGKVGDYKLRRLAWWGGEPGEGRMEIKWQHGMGNRTKIG